MHAHGSRDDGVAEAALTRSPLGFGTPSARDRQRGSILDRWESSEQARLVQNFPAPSLLLSACPVKWQCGRRNVGLTSGALRFAADATARA